MQGDKELRGWKSAGGICFPLPFVCHCSRASREKIEVGTRRYSAPCMLQESPSLPIVLMCLVEEVDPREWKSVFFGAREVEEGPWIGFAQGMGGRGGGKRIERGMKVGGLWEGVCL